MQFADATEVVPINTTVVRGISSIEMVAPGLVSFTFFNVVDGEPRICDRHVWPIDDMLKALKQVSGFVTNGDLSALTPKEVLRLVQHH